MKIAISSNDGKKTSEFSTRFGRCPMFIIYDSKTEKWQSIINPGINAQGGAGTKVVQLLVENQVDVTITGHYGPNAYKAIQATNIKAFQAQTGTPLELLKKYVNNDLEEATFSSKKHH